VACGRTDVTVISHEKLSGHEH